MLEIEGIVTEDWVINMTKFHCIHVKFSRIKKTYLKC